MNYLLYKRFKRHRRIVSFPWPIILQIIVALAPSSMLISESGSGSLAEGWGRADCPSGGEGGYHLITFVRRHRAWTQRKMLGVFTFQISGKYLDWLASYTMSCCSRTTKVPAIIHWSFRIKDTLGVAMLYFVGKLSSSQRFKFISLMGMVCWRVSFMRSCPFLGGSFIGGSTKVLFELYNLHFS